MRIRKPLRELLQQLEPVLNELGAEVTSIEQRGSGHIRIVVRFVAENVVGMLTCSATPSDRRSAKNLISDLRRQAANTRHAPLT